MPPHYHSFYVLYSYICNDTLDKGEKVKVIGRSAERLQPFVDRGAEAAVGDIADVDFLTKAYDSAHAVFALIPPAYTAKDFRGYYNEIGSKIVKAIQVSGVKYIVVLSSHGAQESLSRDLEIVPLGR